jgi:hypothetical protein
VRGFERYAVLRASLLALATLSLVTCAVDTAPSTGTAEQGVITPPIPSDLNLILNAKTTIAIGPFTQVVGDVGSSGVNGSALLDVSAFQNIGGRLVANTVRVQIGAQAGQVIGNDITLDGSAAGQTLGLDPAALPSVPAASAATPGTSNLSVAANQAKQACPGQYGAISLAPNATLNLNGGVYHLTRLTLGDGARLQPSEPVVILVSGNVTTGLGAIISPHPQALNPMSAADIRIEVGGAVTLGESNQVRAHLLVPNGKLATGKNTSLLGAGWAKSISIGAQNFITSDGAFNTHTPAVPPPCNDNNACTADQCVVSGAIAFCSNAALPSGTSCTDGNTCNGEELCDGAGACVRGATPGAGTPCPDGNVCNGNEACDGVGTCAPGTPPVVSDDNTCTADACDPTGGVTHVPLPDGSACNGVGVCTAGVCSVQAHTLVVINDFNGHLERINPDTLVVTDIGAIGVPFAFGDCMFNPSDSRVYMVDGRGNEGLYTLNLTTGAASLIGFHFVSAMEGLAFHPPSNTIFGTSFDVTNLFTISGTTGAATSVGSVAGHRFQGLAYDSKRNMLVAFDGQEMFSVDVTTAALTHLAFTDFVGDFGMTYDAILDRFWVVDTGGRLLQFDPNQGFITTLSVLVPGGHTCIASVPIAF